MVADDVTTIAHNDQNHTCGVARLSSKSGKGFLTRREKIQCVTGRDDNVAQWSNFVVFGLIVMETIRSYEQCSSS